MNTNKERIALAEIDATRAEAVRRLHELETSLTAHGFAVGVEVKFWTLTVTNAADRFGPRRSQRMQLATDTDDNLNWYWVWPRPAGQVKCELLGPAAAIAATTERLAHALSREGRP